MTPNERVLADALTVCVQVLAQIEKPSHAENMALIHGVSTLADVGADVSITRAPKAAPPFKRKGLSLSGIELTLRGDV